MAIEDLLSKRVTSTTKRLTQKFASMRTARNRRSEEAFIIPQIATNPPEAIQKRLARILGLNQSNESFRVAVQERILGNANNLLDVCYFEKGQRAAQAVARVMQIVPARKPLGSGFLVSTRLFLTNNHVLATIAQATNSVVEFEFERDSKGSLRNAVCFVLRPDWFFLTSPQDDCNMTLVAVSPVSESGEVHLSRFGFLPLNATSGEILSGEAVTIIQHLGGGPKQVVLRENKVFRLPTPQSRYLHYRTETAPGSSGSPVLNDQFELVGLHHSGVPATNTEGDWLAIDGEVWTPDMGEDRIKWVANEAIRTSALRKYIEEASGLTAEQTRYRSELLQYDSAPSIEADHTVPPCVLPGESQIITASPIFVSVSLDASKLHWKKSLDSKTPEMSREESLALAELASAASRPYFDSARDVMDRARYYTTINSSLGSANFYDALSRLLRNSHHTRPTYKPSLRLYPWVDLHPDLRLRSIYSGKRFTAEEFIRLDLATDAKRRERMASVSPTEAVSALSAIEASLPYNCEHTVPQSWFSEREPMRGDLHHLFACEVQCNSFRGNTPYFEFAPVTESVLADCGRQEPGRFEPKSGKGAVARATLYFLIRYPGEIGNTARELERDRLQLLLRWHAAFPPDDYERHRNQAIFELQGNRNPLIDHPEWAVNIDFIRGFG